MPGKWGFLTACCEACCEGKTPPRASARTARFWGGAPIARAHVPALCPWPPALPVGGAGEPERFVDLVARPPLNNVAHRRWKYGLNFAITLEDFQQLKLWHVLFFEGCAVVCLIGVHECFIAGGFTP